jgi:hypothetical protein
VRKEAGIREIRVLDFPRDTRHAGSGLEKRVRHGHAEAAIRARDQNHFAGESHPTILPHAFLSNIQHRADISAHSRDGMMLPLGRSM